MNVEATDTIPEVSLYIINLSNQSLQISVLGIGTVWITQMIILEATSSQQQGQPEPHQL